MARLISRTKSGQQKPRLLRAGQAEVEVMISNPYFPNGKSGFNQELHCSVNGQSRKFRNRHFAQGKKDVSAALYLEPVDSLKSPSIKRKKNCAVSTPSVRR
jgi:hypothetical protein